ncbi:MAG: 4-(cytidine 5'-diphospho)-2-C-methyl-D-erythritol kinase [Methyloceanibacter sp.]|uniref:4-(cytidine 5'-diphospho)-2-C-methyl-D-erythritol kinase n=1 Tax=Methyloceanibacter sp. TaxID=1965321 RepID=UPI003D6D5F04
MTAFRDIAWAKVNLTLEVLGRRADGYHELLSLVAFAGVGDTVELEPQDALDLRVEGPFAASLAGPNLILTCAEAAKFAIPGLKLGRFRLVKTLPVAAGLGGGSADAAAVLRLIAKANPGKVTEADLAALAPRLGSDVAVCLRSAPALITGRGEAVSLVRGFPSCGVLLANPGVPLATANVYAALGAPPLAAPPRAPAPPDFAGDFAKLIDYVRSRGNDLEPAATRLVPQIAEVLAALGALDGAEVARLSGSGPTCFALFSTPLEAHRAAGALAQAEPDWWIAASSLGSPNK